MPKRLSKKSTKRLSKRLRTMKRNSKKMSRKSMKGGGSCSTSLRKKSKSMSGGSLGMVGGGILNPK